MRKVVLTLPDDLLNEIARAIRCTRQNRSEFIRQAIHEHLRHLKKECKQLMAEGYREMTKENKRDTTAYLKSFPGLDKQQTSFEP